MYYFELQVFVISNRVYIISMAIAEYQMGQAKNNAQSAIQYYLSFKHYQKKIETNCLGSHHPSFVDSLGYVHLILHLDMEGISKKIVIYKLITLSVSQTLNNQVNNSSSNTSVDYIQKHLTSMHEWLSHDVWLVLILEIRTLVKN